MSSADLRRKFGIFQDSKRKKSRPTTATDEVKHLMAPVPKAGYADTIFGLDIKDWAIHQMDLLFLPHEIVVESGPTPIQETFKYALVVVDVGSRAIDARPLPDKKPPTVVAALRSIYAGTYLREPMKMTSDSGTEFKGAVRTYFRQKKIQHRFTVPGNHGQTGIVERYNQIIGSALFHRQNVEEFQTGRQVIEWVNELPDVIRLINEHVRANWPARKRKLKQKYDGPMPICEEKDCTLLKVGQLVHHALDRPIEVFNKKVIKGSERFRSTDVRWTPEVFRVRDVVLQPYQPPLYRLEKQDGTVVKNRLFAKQKLRLPL
jgi:Integrase core domain